MSDIPTLRNALRAKLKRDDPRSWLDGVATALEELVNELREQGEPHCAHLLQVTVSAVRHAAEREHDPSDTAMPN
jgi:hypothetical protein